MRLAVVVVVVGAMAAAVLVFLVRPAHDHNDGGTAAFFALPTRASCGTGAPEFELDRARFLATYKGAAPAAGGKFLVADVRATPHDVPASELAGHFALQEPAGKAYLPDGASGAIVAWKALPPETSATGELAFAVPLELGAAKLVYDDGCTHEEWLAP